MKTNKSQFGPAFDFDTNKSSVLLNQCPAEITIDGNNYFGQAEVRLDLVPDSQIHIYGKFQGIPQPIGLMLGVGEKKISCFSINKRKIEGFAVNTTSEISTQEVNVKWCPKTEPVVGVGDDSTEITHVVFHLFNFVDLIGTRGFTEQDGDTKKVIEHIDLQYGEWRTELKSLITTKETIKTLKSEGGSRLTHVGFIEKVSSTPFFGKDANDYLTMLRFFLSFTKGGWCEPICAVGYNTSGDSVWECWSSPREHWNKPITWFDPHHSNQLAILFPKFLAKWENEDWRETFYEVIYWYLNANNSSRGIDAGIILAQTAIERLSYEYTVKYRKLLVANGFKSLWASDKFRLLFSTLRIPLGIPSETPELLTLAVKDKMNWIDAPQALTEIRNALVHPEQKNRSQLKKAYYEAWKLSLWYLEMSILAICDYHGTYGNRIKQRWIGQVEDVPW